MSIVFDPGELDRRVTLEQRSVSRHATYGSEVETWSTLVADIAAKVVQSSGAAGLSTGTSEAVASYARPTRVWIRWRAGVTRENHRLRYGGQLLRILGVAEIGRRAGLELACAEWAHE